MFPWSGIDRESFVRRKAMCFASFLLELEAGSLEQEAFRRLQEGFLATGFQLTAQKRRNRL